MTCYFKNINDFFKKLNDAGINYLVLRNYENFHKPEIFINGHGDVDMLCDDSQAIVSLIDAISKRPDEYPLRGDGIHYYIIVGENEVSLDLRQIGDGYYCDKWEKDMLENRVMHDGFYVMDNENYFYSLIYHAILQKKFLSDDYINRLTCMANQINVVIDHYNEKGFINALEKYMRQHNYVFTYSYDYVVPNRFNLVDKSLIKPNYKLWWRHFRYNIRISTIEHLVKFKHFLQCHK